MYGTYKSR
jgi:hypothetical protein